MRKPTADDLARIESDLAAGYDETGYIAGVMLNGWWDDERVRGLVWSIARDPRSIRQAREWRDECLANHAEVADTN